MAWVASSRKWLRQKDTDKIGNAMILFRSFKRARLFMPTFCRACFYIVTAVTNEAWPGRGRQAAAVKSVCGSFSSYILKAKKFAESAFQSQQIAEKVRNSQHQIFATKVRISFFFLNLKKMFNVGESETKNMFIEHFWHFFTTLWHFLKAFAFCDII